MRFIRYTYNWVRPLDDMPIDTASRWWGKRSPVQRQLLGESKYTAHHWSIDCNDRIDEEIPLRREVKGRNLLDRRIPWLR